MIAPARSAERRRSRRGNFRFDVAAYRLEAIAHKVCAAMDRASSRYSRERTLAANRQEIDMGNERLAAFSDGVIAIIITIMVLELKVPNGADWGVLQSVAPSFIAYVLSFVYMAIYWNNHHHLLHTVSRVDGLILWANSNLLFWLSLVPAATGWLGQNFLKPIPTAVYGAILLMPAISYTLLEMAILHRHGRGSLLARALGRDLKGKLSPLLYVAGTLLAFLSPGLAVAIYVLVAVIWLVPDARIEKAVRETAGDV
jgi:uncharacterized membrane protein